MIDLWGSATMRTGGEDLALALVLAGAEPLWARLQPGDRLRDRSRGPARPSGVDVTLRISGLFRDAFEAQIAMFDAVVGAIGRRQEPSDVNPLAGAAGNLGDEAFRRATTRIYGAAPAPMAPACPR